MCLCAGEEFIIKKDGDYAPSFCILQLVTLKAFII